MAFYQARTIGYGVAQKLGRYSGVTGDTSSSGFRRATYGTAKFLGDVNATGKKGNLGRRLVSRLSGSVLRSGRVNTGISQLDNAYARYASEQMGRVAMATQGNIYRDSSGISSPKVKYKVQWLFTIDTAEMQGIFVQGAGGSTTTSEGQKMVKEKIEEATQDILSYIQTNAPVKTGQYKNSFYVRYIETENGPVGIVKTEDPKFIHLEYGTTKMAPRRVIRASIEQSKLARPAPELRSLAYELDV
jgi:hypothetical protein